MTVEEIRNLVRDDDDDNQSVVGGQSLPVLWRRKSSALKCEWWPELCSAKGFEERKQKQEQLKDSTGQRKFRFK